MAKDKRIRKMTVTFHCENDAFYPDAKAEIANIFENLAHMVKHNGFIPDDNIRCLFDSNGNPVGTAKTIWTVKKEEDFLR